MTRDMTDEQFHQALKRNGFTRQGGLWAEHPEFPNVWFGLVTRGGKIARRLSIANLILRLKQRREEQKRKAR